MRILFVMDPVSTINVDEDTSFALMLAAQERGHRVDHCLVRDVALDGSRVCATVRRAAMQLDRAKPVALGDPEDLALEDTDVIFVRKDPPFDEEYHWLTLLLEHVRGRALIVNDPRGLREANEKLYACNFPDLMPRTLVSSCKRRIKHFLDEVNGKAVIKPVEGHGGGGVFALIAGDNNVNGLIEAVTRDGTRVAMVQALIPEVTEGDKRILLLEGEPLGAILRVPQGDWRSNIHVGGRVVRAELADADRRIIAAVAPRVRADGLWLVGLDVIGGKLTEVNVTSPTGIQQMSRFDEVDYPGRVVDWLERRVGAA
jgi:glutathione synthase